MTSPLYVYVPTEMTLVITILIPFHSFLYNNFLFKKGTHNAGKAAMKPLQLHTANKLIN